MVEMYLINSLSTEGVNIRIFIENSMINIGIGQIAQRDEVQVCVV